MTIPTDSRQRNASKDGDQNISLLYQGADFKTIAVSEEFALPVRITNIDEFPSSGS